MTPEGGLVVTGVWLPQQERSAPLAKFQMKQTLFPELGKPIFHIPFPGHTDWVKVGHSTWVKIVGAHVMQMCGQWNVEPSVEKTHPSTGQGGEGPGKGANSGTGRELELGQNCAFWFALDSPCLVLLSHYNYY